MTGANTENSRKSVRPSVRPSVQAVTNKYTRQLQPSPACLDQIRHTQTTYIPAHPHMPCHAPPQPPNARHGMPPAVRVSQPASQRSSPGKIQRPRHATPRKQRLTASSSPPLDLTDVTRRTSSSQSVSQSVTRQRLLARWGYHSVARPCLVRSAAACAVPRGAAPAASAAPPWP